MKIKNKLFPVFFMAMILLPLVSCKKFLKEEIYTQYDPETFLNTDSGIQKVIIGAYSQLQLIYTGSRDVDYTMGEFTGDEMWMKGGGYESQAKPFLNFQWDSSLAFFKSTYAKMYRAIRDANVLLDNIDNVQGVSDTKIAAYKAEAKFIRANAYICLYNLFGATPLITTAKTLDFLPSKPTDQVMKDFIASELTDAAINLPLTQALTGKATKGAALAQLAKFYLNTRQWQKANDACQQVIDLKIYGLVPDITTLFAVQNENNKEFIYVTPMSNLAGFGNIFMSSSFPLGYPIQTNWTIFGAQFMLYTSFVKSFDANDKRRQMILTSFVNTSGATVQLLEDASGKPLDNARSFKFTPDPNAQSDTHGNDLPIVRYADILLSKAEAINELNGPTQASIDLINDVRRRSNAPIIFLTSFTTKDALRDRIVLERGWEFFSEGKRREDLIRTNKFITGAVSRGKLAKEYQVLFPIPQSEIDANTSLKQNTGY